MLLPERKAAAAARKLGGFPNRLIFQAFMVSDSEFLKSLSVRFP